jgi:hypothetical protein
MLSTGHWLQKALHQVWIAKTFILPNVFVLFREPTKRFALSF